MISISSLFIFPMAAAILPFTPSTPPYENDIMSEKSYSDTESAEYHYNKNDYINTYKLDVLSTDDDSNLSIASIRSRSRKVTTRDDRREKGCYFFQKQIKNYYLKVFCFATKSTPGTQIRHAITKNVEYGYVGTVHENLYFKVRFVSGELKEKNEYGNDLYYYTPEEYERHFQVVVSPIVKEKWEKKRAEYMAVAKPSGQNKTVTIIK